MRSTGASRRMTQPQGSAAASEHRQEWREAHPAQTSRLACSHPCDVRGCPPPKTNCARLSVQLLGHGRQDKVAKPSSTCLSTCLSPRGVLREEGALLWSCHGLASRVQAEGQRARGVECPEEVGLPEPPAPRKDHSFQRAGRLASLRPAQSRPSEPLRCLSEPGGHAKPPRSCSGGLRRPPPPAPQFLPP